MKLSLLNNLKGNACLAINGEPSGVVHELAVKDDWARCYNELNNPPSALTTNICFERYW